MQYSGYSFDMTEHDMYNDNKPESFTINLLQGVIFQAVHDILSPSMANSAKGDALEWLSDEDNEMLQLCLSVCNIDHEHLLLRVSKQGWNLDL